MTAKCSGRQVKSGGNFMTERCSTCDGTREAPNNEPFFSVCLDDFHDQARAEREVERVKHYQTTAEIVRTVAAIVTLVVATLTLLRVWGWA